jgi:5-bromo-4-chloroindolyl phosphate hydrolysis protein
MEKHEIQELKQKLAEAKKEIQVLKMRLKNAEILYAFTQGKDTFKERVFSPAT